MQVLNSGRRLNNNGHRSQLHPSVFSIGNIHILIFQTSDGTLQLRCKTCSTPIHSHKTIPPSPTPHLHHTIQAPNATEAIRLREALRLATPIVPQLDDDISHLQMLLDELRRKREPLLNFIAEQNTILAPIRRLPAEILAKIFVLCMNYDTSSFDPMQSPLLVGRVCRGWRQVALSTQKLWSSITVTNYRSSSKMVKLWMSRAISAPLTIHLDSTYRSAGEIESAIAVLVQYCDRWQHLDMNFYRTPPSCLTSIRRNLPLLESLRIRSSTAFVNIFEVAPHLHTLSLDSWTSRIRLKVPWSQLTELETEVSCSTDGLYTLKLMPNLVKCTMHKSNNSGSVLPHNITILTLSHLRFFCLLSIRPDNIFNHLHLPTISALRIRYQDKWQTSDTRWYSRQPFISLLSSHTLRKLEIEDGLSKYEDSTHIAHFLQAMPALEELHLRGLDSRWVTADLLHLLTRRANTDVLVPALETLEISSEFIPCGPSTSMIESRWRIAKEDGYGGARLKRLQFLMSVSNNWLVDVENLNRLRKCRQEGMVISIIGRYHCLRKDLLDLVINSE